MKFGKKCQQKSFLRLGVESLLAALSTAPFINKSWGDQGLTELMRAQSNDQCNTSFIYLHVCVYSSVAVPQRAVAHRPPVLRHRTGPHQRGRRLRLAHRRAHERFAVSDRTAKRPAVEATVSHTQLLLSAPPRRPGDESVSVTDLLDLSSVSLPSTGSSPPPLVPCSLPTPPSSASLRGSSPPPSSSSSQPVEVSSSSGHRLSSEPPEHSPPPSSTLSSLPSTTPTSASASAPTSAAASFVSQLCGWHENMWMGLLWLLLSFSSYTAKGNIEYGAQAKI